MKKVKYYYSQCVHLRTMPIITDAEGNPTYIPDVKPIKIKVLPRITVAAVWDTIEDKMYFGSTICAPADVFKKSIGRELAYQRALESPEIIVKLTRRGKIRSVSKRYANQLINSHLHKYIRSVE